MLQTKLKEVGHGHADFGICPAYVLSLCSLSSHLNGHVYSIYCMFEVCDLFFLLFYFAEGNS